MLKDNKLGVIPPINTTYYRANKRSSKNYLNIVFKIQTMRNIYIFISLIAAICSCGEYAPSPQVDRSLEEPIILARENGQYTIESTVETFDLFAEDGSSIVKDGKITIKPNNGYQIFKATTGKDTFYLGERNLNAKGVPNLRDVGGLFTNSGYQIQWGKIFRSGKLSELDQEEFQRLSTIGLKTIVDFRTQEEKEEDPDQWPNIDQINTIELPIGDEDGKSNREWLKELNEADFDANKFMYEASKGFVKEHADKYKEFFKALLDEANYPLLFHCSAGKDRAGFASFLILSALNVAPESKLNEYLLSNFYLQYTSEEDIKKASQFYGIDQDKLRALMKVKPEYIQGSLDVIKSDYGNISDFLCEALEVCDAEIEQLKRIMLYDYKSTYNTERDNLGVELPSNADSYSVNYLMEGAPNFRVFNIPTDHTLQVKPNLIFRSNSLQNLTGADLAKLEALNLKTIIDFRYKEEIDEDPDKKPSTLENYINPVISRNKNSLQYQIDSAQYMTIRKWFIDGEFEKVDSVMKALDINTTKSRLERYASFALDYTDSYGEFMKTLAKSESYPVVYHCQGGKDRAGFASAILLKTLGFDDQIIVNDFLTTNLHTYVEISNYYESGVKSLNQTIGAHSEHLMFGLRAAAQKYGSFEKYLTEGLKLTEEEIKAIRANLLLKEE